MPIRDFDSGQRARRILLLALACVGALFGGLLAEMLAPITGTTGPTAPIVGAIIGAGVIVAERYAGEPAGRWARGQLNTIKAQAAP